MEGREEMEVEAMAKVEKGAKVEMVVNGVVVDWRVDTLEVVASSVAVAHAVGVEESMEQAVVATAAAMGAGQILPLTCRLP